VAIPPDATRNWELRRIYEFEHHGAPVVAFSASRRHKGFLTGDTNGGLHFNYGTTGETLLTLAATSHPLTAVAFARAGRSGLGRCQRKARAVEPLVPHPEVTLRSLFGKVWYEGYERPSTSGNRPAAPTTSSPSSRSRRSLTAR